jgi:hypothetical protein
MGGVTTQSGGGVTVVYHADDDLERLETTLTAVVVWRISRATHAGWRARLRRWRYRLGLNPLLPRFSIGRNPGHWYGSSGMLGEHETLFHPVLRVVRVLGEQYPIPQRGTTLLLLIDETGATPRVQVKQMPAPSLSRTAAQLNPAFGVAREEGQREEANAWRAALDAQRDIAAFIAGIPGEGRLIGN